VRDAFGVSERRGCRALRFHRSSHRTVGRRDDQAPLRQRIEEIAAVRIRYGYPRIHVLLQREGWKVNRKRVYRLYRVEGLNLRRKRPRRHVTAARRSERDVAGEPNQQWSMDFVSDALFDGRRIRALTLVDNFTREALAIVVDGGIRGEHVVQAVEQVAAQRGAPRLIRVDNGPEFVSKVLDRWAYERGVTLDFSRPGKPTDNCFVESFNGRLRDECLNTHWFLSVEDAKAKIEAWRRDYNAFRPHSALGQLTPQEFAAQTARKGGQ
jgi:putative transposase